MTRDIAIVKNTCEIRTEGIIFEFGSLTSLSFSSKYRGEKTAVIVSRFLEALSEETNRRQCFLSFCKQISNIFSF